MFVVNASGSSPTAHRSSDWSAPSWPNRTTNGPMGAATSDSMSYPAWAPVIGPLRQPMVPVVPATPG